MSRFRTLQRLKRALGNEREEPLTREIITRELLFRTRLVLGKAMQEESVAGFAKAFYR